MMKVTDLNREQLIELKGQYVCDHDPEAGWGAFAYADELVTDEEIFKEYAGTLFESEDFSAPATDDRAA